ncbi:hypothetical protein ON010_g4125 [Phytophthora cinnamomi]|nr:hypothetical protein ON010_g4125 [Phytophthora cinnamomi]
MTTHVGLLLAISPALEKAGHVAKAYQIAESYAVSSGFFALCLEKFAEDATAKASRAAAQQKSSGHTPSIRETRQEVEEEDSDDEDFGSKRGKKGKRAKGGNKRDQEESSGKSGKSGKGKKGKRASKRGGDLGGDDESSSASAQVFIVPSREETIELLVKWFPAVEDLEGDDEFMDGMVAYLKPKLDEVYSTALTKALSSILRGDAASLRELRKTFEDRFDEQFTKLLILEKGFNKLSMHVDAKDPVGMEQLAIVETHVLDSSSVEIAALVTSFVAESNSLELGGVPLLSSPSGNNEEKNNAVIGPLTSLSDENKKVLESSLPQATASALVRLWTLATAGRRSLSDFMAHVPVLAEALSMPLRKLDRKKERQVIFGYRQATLAELDEKVTQALESSDQYAVIVALVLQLFFQQITALPGSFPRDTVTYGDMVLKAFRDSLPEKATAIMQSFVTLAGTISCADDVSEDQKSSWAENLEAARALVLLKDLNSVE